MAEAVENAFKSNSLLVVEAGTGTGKTLAYLLPAIMSGKQTVISTGLLNLQDQIYNKDLPFIERYFGGKFNVTLLKGRHNYLCLWKMWSLRRRKVHLFTDPKVEKAFDALTDWSKKTNSGFKEEIYKEIKRQIAWEDVSADGDDCLGQRCRRQKECFVAKARKAALGADLILVNHHLFMADLALKDDLAGQVLPNWEAAVLDEAHMLESVATDYFGYSISNYYLRHLTEDIEKAADVWPTLGRHEDKIIDLSKYCDLLETFFPDLKGEKELFFDKNEPWNTNFRTYLTELMDIAFNVADKIDEADAEQAQSEELGALSKKLKRVVGALRFLAGNLDPQFVYQAQAVKKRLTISALPLNVGPFLKDHLTESGKTVVMTSATLSANGNFKYFQKSLGVSNSSKCLNLPSPYDFATKTLLYIPKHLPVPNENVEIFWEAMIPEVEKLLTLSQGRALVLFTSTAKMMSSYEALKDSLPFTILVQDEKPRNELLAEFKADVNSVLFATASFWQGVDVPGESLTSVIIEKLPFTTPNKPIQKARERLLIRQGSNYFKEYSLPEATLKLKQGVGRLIRHENDRGVLAILDNRLWNKNYASSIQNSLPASPKTTKIEDVANFLGVKLVSPPKPPGPPLPTPSPPSDPKGGIITLSKKPLKI
jgi:ATP-dependent DNA helicase DinG